MRRRIDNVATTAWAVSEVASAIAFAERKGSTWYTATSAVSDMLEARPYTRAELDALLTAIAAHPALGSAVASELGGVRAHSYADVGAHIRHEYGE